MSNHYPHPIIAREGWPFIALALTISVLLSVFCPWLSLTLFSWLITVFVVQFFRDPAREIPTQANAVLSPADGRIVVIEPCEDPYLHRPALKISVFMNVFNVHSNRIPVDAVVKNQWYNKGKFMNADFDKASLENERNALHLVMANGHEITCVQIAGLVARRILCYVDNGKTVSRGERYGFIRFGSRVDLYLPPDSVVKVGLGDTVSATSTILAELP